MLIIISGLFVTYIILFLLSIYLKDNSIADIFWGFGFVLIAWISYFLSDANIIQILLTLLVTTWGIRLTLHIGSKKFGKKGEDPRYARWREDWKYFYTRSFFQVYLFQGFLMLLIAFPLYAHLYFEASANIEKILILGALIALFGLLYETVADVELKQFVLTKKPGEILTGGLRKFHRYPQYFGESLFWFGISIVALTYTPLVFLSWMLITFLLTKVSGIPLQEARYKDNQSYQDYANHTPVFFPDWSKVWGCRGKCGK
ncbi:DUF1295 domain-containing protein [Candidatus Gracilibacteria bacterium]|nr:DUF1295 domain-containing protein [Candidatus Gracilibacteria bacterium]